MFGSTLRRPQVHHGRVRSPSLPPQPLFVVPLPNVSSAAAESLSSQPRADRSPAWHLRVPQPGTVQPRSEAPGTNVPTLGTGHDPCSVQLCCRILVSTVGHKPLTTSRFKTNMKLLLLGHSLYLIWPARTSCHRFLLGCSQLPFQPPEETEMRKSSLSGTGPLTEPLMETTMS
jgi:hypothetical protein